ncbi:HAMP domain-containing protein [Oxynema sp. CENA135]|uniref:sensor histidine kinase n=1 Tax=Oxynema sp. CENA135 TaxID=984206 RepID=UPI001A4CAF8E|nr:ATP-binding protein [Oxynema sp. CENA135]MBK4732516.1 HAMP domain-containing protein [Oxynema sp. CENA135]
MQLEHSYQSLETAKRPTLANRFSASILSGSVLRAIGTWTRKVRRLSIKQKICYGYAVTIAIAMVGTGVGLEIGDRYTRQAREQSIRSHEEQRLLLDLQHTVLAVRARQEGLSPSDGDDLERVEDLLAQLHDLATAPSPISGAVTPAQIAQLKAAYDPKPGAVSDGENGDRATRIAPIEQLYQAIDRRIEAAKTQERLANETFEKAESLRQQITGWSMLVSAAIAVALAVYTSRAIAHPIEWIVHVARRASQQANYKLRAPEIGEDEIGLLATSLNQLISTVQQQIQAIQTTQAQLIQSEKMSSLGQMVAGLAHEINNPVSFISGNIEHSSHYIQDLLGLVLLYQQEYPEPNPTIARRIEEIDLDFLMTDLPGLLCSMRSGSERIRQLVMALRNFCRLDEAEVKRVNLHEGIDSTLFLLDRRLKDKIKIVKKYGDLPAIECAPAQVNQVFMHLLDNAIDALEGIGTDESSRKMPTIAIQTRLVEDNRIQVKITDNGPGIDPEIQAKIFDPFFTTKAPGKGTGLGLAICYQIAQQHGGTLEFSSQLGRGSKFCLSLPLPERG